MASPRTRSPYPLIADLISYGYAVITMVVLLATDVYLTSPQAVAIVVLYFLLRWAAKEIKRTVVIAERRELRPR